MVPYNLAEVASNVVSMKARPPKKQNIADEIWQRVIGCDSVVVNDVI